MALGDQWQSRALALDKLGQRIGQIRTVGDGTEIAAGARAEAVAELIDRPQIDACGVEREAVPVVDAGVLTEAVQEDDSGAWFLGGPVPVVGPALRVLDERHADDLSGHSCQPTINCCHRN